MAARRLPTYQPQRIPAAERQAPKRPKRQLDQFGKLPRLTEKRFQAQVIELAAYLGWRAYHTWTSIHSAAGFPDLVLVRRPRVLFVELKAEGKGPTDAQADWLADLQACGQETYLWRPSDFEEIERTLAR